MGFCVALSSALDCIPNPFYNFLAGLVAALPADGVEETLQPYASARTVLIVEFLFPRSLFNQTPYYFTERQRELLDWVRHMMAYQIADTVCRPIGFYTEKKLSRIGYYAKYYGCDDDFVVQILHEIHEAYKSASFSDDFSADQATIATHIMCQFFAIAASMVGVEKYAYLLDLIHCQQVDVLKELDGDHFFALRGADQGASPSSGTYGSFVTTPRSTELPSACGDKISPRKESRSSWEGVLRCGAEPRSLPCSPYAVPPMYKLKEGDQKPWTAPSMPILSSHQTRPSLSAMLAIHRTIQQIYSPPAIAKGLPSLASLKREPVPWIWWLLDEGGLFPPRRIRYVLYVRLLNELQKSVPKSYCALYNHGFVNNVERPLWPMEDTTYVKTYLASYISGWLVKSLRNTVHSRAHPRQLQGYKIDLVSLLLTNCGLLVMLAAFFSVISFWIL